MNHANAIPLNPNITQNHEIALDGGVRIEMQFIVFHIYSERVYMASLGLQTLDKDDSYIYIYIYT